MKFKTWNFLWEAKTVPSAWIWRSKPGNSRQNLETCHPYQQLWFQCSSRSLKNAIILLCIRSTRPAVYKLRQQRRISYFLWDLNINNFLISIAFNNVNRKTIRFLDKQTNVAAVWKLSIFSVQIITIYLKFYVFVSTIKLTLANVQQVRHRLITNNSHLIYFVDKTCGVYV
jgi:hypothetical protein